MLFGLCDAAQIFQRFIGQVARGLNFVFSYMDDILFISKFEEDQSDHPGKLFELLAEHVSD